MNSQSRRRRPGHLLKKWLVLALWCLVTGALTPSAYAIEAGAAGPQVQVTEDVEAAADPVASAVRAGHEGVTVFEAPEPSRAVLMLIGCAMLFFCYRGAWVGRRKRT